MAGMLGGLGALSAVARGGGGDGSGGGGGGGGVESMLGGWVHTLQSWAQAVEAAVTGLWRQLMGVLGKVAGMLPGGGHQGAAASERAPLLG